MSDTAIVKAIQNNDDAAFKQLFDRYYKQLLAYTVTFTYDIVQAEDIVQQAFVSLWTRRQQLHPEKSPKNYLYSIAYNIYIDEYRKMRRRDLFFDELKEKALQDRIEEDLYLMEQRISKLKKIIESLPPRCKEILQLNKLEGIKYKEIASTLNISIKTVESQMRIAFQKIREGFENDDNLILFFLFDLSSKQKFTFPS